MKECDLRCHMDHFWNLHYDASIHFSSWGWPWSGSMGGALHQFIRLVLPYLSTVGWSVLVSCFELILHTCLPSPTKACNASVLSHYWEGEFERGPRVSHQARCGNECGTRFIGSMVTIHVNAMPNRNVVHMSPFVNHHKPDLAGVCDDNGIRNPRWLNFPPVSIRVRIRMIRK